MSNQHLPSSTAPQQEDWLRALRVGTSTRPWRSFADLLDSDELRASLRAEFPVGVDLPPEECSRRGFLALLAASVALSGLSGCTRAPEEKIIPYARQPVEVIPGVSSHYATTMTLDGYGTGLLVESHEGRPTKVEGNPRHPASMGATRALEQASVLSLYDPARARGIRYAAQPKSFQDVVAMLRTRVAGTADGGLLAQGEGVHLVLEPTGSPTTVRLLEQLRSAYPRLSVHFYAPLHRQNAWQGSALAFGRTVDTELNLRDVDLLVALDADVFADGPAALRYARDFSARRRVRSTRDSMNRLYVAESALTVTGSMADHRLRIRRSDVGCLAAALLSELATLVPVAPELAVALQRHRAKSEHTPWIAALARDLTAHAGRSAVVVGDGQPPLVHALGHWIDSALGNAGQVVKYRESPIYEAGGESHGLGRLVAALDARTVDTLIILGGNPVYAAPADLELGRRLGLAREQVYLGQYANETAACCAWFVPQAHYLESWGDARAYDGTASLLQPLIEPLFGGHTADELLAALGGYERPHPYQLVRSTWRKNDQLDFEESWERWLQQGVIDATTLSTVSLTPSWQDAARLVADDLTVAPGTELSFTPDACVRDGAFSNNAWLLELPSPITKLTWENALLISPQTAATLGLSTEDLVSITLRGRSATVPVFVTPGHADQTVSLALGYGRAGGELLARGLGVNANRLRTHDAPLFATGVVLEKQTGRHPLATTQLHWSLAGRNLVPRSTLAEYRAEPRFAKDPEQPKASLYKLPLTGAQQWGMSIDLNVCNGCSACVVACQAENNTPVVGKAGVLMHREMHWIRIDRYFEGSPQEPKVSVQPMLCQHCEKAPCEYVCPVNATVHSPDGLNEQVYNRCVGTRFCSNNCAWKVRRFNWFNYHEQAMRSSAGDGRALHKLVMNPDVTVRARGVMEKCTYCVQRIRGREIAAKISHQPLKDGDVVPACAQACPTQAITFGSLSMVGSQVRQLRDNERDYAVLGELGTEPRTRYLARLDNPNPELRK